jgi:hypothetical protein
MASILDVTVTELIEASPDRVRRLMFDPCQEPPADLRRLKQVAETRS